MPLASLPRSFRESLQRREVATRGEARDAFRERQRPDTAEGRRQHAPRNPSTQSWGMGHRNRPPVFQDTEKVSQSGEPGAVRLEKLRKVVLAAARSRRSTGPTSAGRSVLRPPGQARLRLGTLVSPAVHGQNRHGRVERRRPEAAAVPRSPGPQGQLLPAVAEASLADGSTATTNRSAGSHEPVPAPTLRTVRAPRSSRAIRAGQRADPLSSQPVIGADAIVGARRHERGNPGDRRHAARLLEMPPIWSLQRTCPKKGNHGDAETIES